MEIWLQILPFFPYLQGAVDLQGENSFFFICRKSPNKPQMGKFFYSTDCIRISVLFFKNILPFCGRYKSALARNSNFSENPVRICAIVSILFPVYRYKSMSFNISSSFTICFAIVRYFSSCKNVCLCGFICGARSIASQKSFLSF